MKMYGKIDNKIISKPTGATPQDGPFGDVPNWNAVAWKPTRPTGLLVSKDSYFNPCEGHFKIPDPERMIKNRI